MDGIVEFEAYLRLHGNFITSSSLINDCSVGYMEWKDTHSVRNCGLLTKHNRAAKSVYENMDPCP